MNLGPDSQQREPDRLLKVHARHGREARRGDRRLTGSTCGQAASLGAVLRMVVRRVTRVQQKEGRPHRSAVGQNHVISIESFNLFLDILR